MALYRFGLKEEDTEVEGDRVETATEGDARARCLGRGFMFVDHFAHPAGFAAKIGIGGARADAGGDEFAAVKLVRADRRQHDFRALRHLVEARGIARVGDDQGRFGACADKAANLGQLVEAAARHRPFGRVLAALVVVREIFGDEAAGKACRAVDDDVEIAGRHGKTLPLRKR